MAASKHPLKIDRYAGFSDLTYWRVGPTAATATPVNLLGWTARMHIREHVDSPVVLMERTTLNGGIVLGGVLGSVEIAMTEAETSAITWVSGVYDLLLIPPVGKVRRHFYGPVSVSQGVTHD